MVFAFLCRQRSEGSIAQGEKQVKIIKFEENREKRRKKKINTETIKILAD